MKTDHRKTRPKPPQLNEPDWKLAKHCVCCDSMDSTHEISINSTMLIHGKETDYQANKYQCSACKHTFQSPAQATKGAKQARAAYQSAHGLLEPSEIENLREGLSLSFSQVATLANVGIASIKRWESGKAIQTIDNDKKLREAFRKYRENKLYKEETYTISDSKYGWGKISFSSPAYLTDAFSTPPEEEPYHGISEQGLCAT